MITNIEFSLTLFGAGAVVNTTDKASDGNSLTAEMKTFYDKALIELASPNLVHQQFAQKRKIPKNGGKSIEFRSFSALPKVSTKLTEGVTPNGNKINVQAISCTPEQYGDYVELSDVLELTSVDNTILETTKKLADQAGRTLDTVVRNELNGGTNVMFCPDKDENGAEVEVKSRFDLGTESKLTVKQVFKAAAELKAMNAPKIDGYYVGIIHPYVAYDLMQDAGERWMNVSEYAKPGERYKGEIGCVGGVRFVETTEAQIYAPTLDINGFRSAKILEGGVGEMTAVLDIPAANIRYKQGLIVYIDGMEYCALELRNESGRAVIELDIPFEDEMTGKTIYVSGGTKDALSVFSTLILGADAYGVTEMEDGIENIIKQKGYGDDPLNQRSSIGWKAFMCAKRLVEEYMIRVESVSAFSSTAPAN